MMTKTRFFPSSAPLLFLTQILIAVIGCHADDLLQGGTPPTMDREVALMAELEAARQNQEALNVANNELLQKEALWSKERERTSEELDRLATELETLRTHYESEKRSLLAENDRLRSETREAESQIQAQNVAMEREISEVIIPNHSRQATRLQFSDPSILPPRREGENLVIEIQDHLLFTPENDKLSEEGFQRLQGIATEILRLYPDADFQIAGHVAPTSENRRKGTELSDLTFQKAKIVATTLIDDCGVPADRISITGAGITRPRVPPTSDQNDLRNDRIEWIILGGG